MSWVYENRGGIINIFFFALRLKQLKQTRFDNQSLIFHGFCVSSYKLGGTIIISR